MVRSLVPDGGRVLEVGCGAGVGLTKLSDAGLDCIGVEYDTANVTAFARDRGHIHLVHGSAEALPLSSQSVNVAALLEVIYYLRNQQSAIAELARVCRPGGFVVISWPNPARLGLVRSPFSTHYPDPSELIAWLAPWCTDVQVFGAFPVGQRWNASSLLRLLASRLRFIPSSLQARGRIKRLVGMGGEPLSDFELRSSEARLFVLAAAPNGTVPIMLYAIGTRAP